MLTNHLPYGSAGTASIVMLDVGSQETQGLTSAIKVRFVSSLKALGFVWLIAGLLFVAIIKGPGTVSAWFIWGTAVFIVGWIFVAIPLIVFGGRIHQIPYLALTCFGGLGGALLMLSPNIFVRLVSSHVHYSPFSIRDLAWPSAAFGVAAASTALYRFFLDRASSDRMAADASIRGGCPK